MQQFGPGVRERGVNQIRAEPAASDRLATFVRDEGQALLRFAFLLTGGNTSAAEDLVQTVLLRLVHRGIDDLADPRTYARRALVNEQRSLGRRTMAHVRALSRLGHPADVSRYDTGPEDRMVVLEALTALTDRERAAVVLRYYEDAADVDIAEVLGCSRGTVRSLVHRAMPKLKRAIEMDRPAPDDPRTDGES